MKWKKQDRKELLKMEKITNLSPRCWWLYRLVKSYSEQGKRISLEEIVEYQNANKEKLTFTNFYQIDQDDKNKNCSAIYEDKDQINESEEIDKILCCKNREFYIGSEQENIEYHNKLMKKVCDYSHKAKLIREKISQNGQMKLFTYDLVEMEKSKNGRDYHETYLLHQNLVEELEKYKNLIQLYKNENQMWKERYEQAKVGNVKYVDKK